MCYCTVFGPQPALVRPVKPGSRLSRFQETLYRSAVLRLCIIPNGLLAIPCQTVSIPYHCLDIRQPTFDKLASGLMLLFSMQERICHRYAQLSLIGAQAHYCTSSHSHPHHTRRANSRGRLMSDEHALWPCCPECSLDTVRAGCSTVPQRTRAHHRYHIVPLAPGAQGIYACALSGLMPTRRARPVHGLQIHRRGHAAARSGH